jgi:hypothetical protein
LTRRKWKFSINGGNLSMKLNICKSHIDCS